MNFIKGRDELKKLGACLFWFLITFVFGFLVSYIFLKYKTKFDDFWCLQVAIAVGVCFWILTLIFNCSIKSIKAGFFEAASSKTGSDPDRNYKVFYYGIGPYVANRLGIKYPEGLHSSEAYHLCEINFYETIANRRFWNIFCPFIETEALTVKEIDDIIRYSIIQPNIQLTIQLTIQLNTQLNK